MAYHITTIAADARNKLRALRRHGLRAERAAERDTWRVYHGDVFLGTADWHRSEGETFQGTLTLRGPRLSDYGTVRQRSRTGQPSTPVHLLDAQWDEILRALGIERGERTVAQALRAFAAAAPLARAVAEADDVLPG